MKNKKELIKIIKKEIKANIFNSLYKVIKSISNDAEISMEKLINVLLHIGTKTLLEKQYELIGDPLKKENYKKGDKFLKEFCNGTYEYDKIIENAMDKHFNVLRESGIGFDNFESAEKFYNDYVNKALTGYFEEKKNR